MNFLRSKKAQAILELAIFGAILIMLLGVLLSYGLKDSLQQKTTMNAFRGALKESNDNGGQGSFMLLEDNHIPSPGNPFAVGSVEPFIASGSVVRSSALHEVADSEEQLPRIAIDMKGSKCPGSGKLRDGTYLSAPGSNPPCKYFTANFRDIHNAITITIPGGVDEEGKPLPDTTTTQYAMVTGMNKFKEVYGDSNAWTIKDCSDDGYGNPMCSDTGVRVIDSCEGEIIDYDSCKRQCRFITDDDFCEKECNKGKEPSDTKNCHAVCFQEIETPWYCQPWGEQAGKIVLDKLFTFATDYKKPKTMGLQQDYKQQTIMNNSLRKEEGTGSMRQTTTDSIQWTSTTDREMIYMDPDTRNLKQPTPTISSKVGESTKRVCKDGVCP